MDGNNNVILRNKILKIYKNDKEKIFEDLLKYDNKDIKKALLFFGYDHKVFFNEMQISLYFNEKLISITEQIGKLLSGFLATKEKEQKQETLEEKIHNKVSEIREAIINNEFGNKSKDILVTDNIFIKVKYVLAKCDIALKKKNFNTFDWLKKESKLCNIYVIDVYDTLTNEFKSKDEIIVLDKKTNENYRIFAQDKNANYDFSDILENEKLCYMIDGFAIPQRKIANIDVQIKQVTTPNIKQNIQYDELLKQGIELYNENMLNQALACFQEASRSNVRLELSQVNRWIGKIYFAQKALDVAEKYFLKSLNYNKYDYSTLLELGKTYSFKGEADKALECYTKCHSIDSNSVAHYFEKGICYRKKGLYTQAWIQFQKGVQLTPDNFFFHLEKAKIYIALKEYELAKEILLYCQRFDSQNIRYYLFLGQIAFLENDISLSEKYFNKCINYDKKNNSDDTILEIGAFFHALDLKDLACFYYNYSSRLMKHLTVEDSKIEKHLKEHEIAVEDDYRHSIFNFPIHIETIQKMIADIEKTEIINGYDIYNIYCENAGYILLDDGTKVPRNYITVLTLPFTKKIKTCYAGYPYDFGEVNYAVNLQDLIDSDGRDFNLVDLEKNRQENISKKLKNM